MEQDQSRTEGRATPIDHLILGAPDLAAAVEEFAQLTGVNASFGGEHRGHGSSNYLLSAGGRTYLELLGPTPNAAEVDEWGLKTFPGIRLMGLVVATSDLDGLMRRAQDLGLKMDPPRDGARTTPAGDNLRWRVAFFDRSVFGEFLVFAIEWAEGAHPSTNSPGGITVADVTVRSSAAPLVSRYLHDLCNADVQVLPCDEGLHLEAHLDAGKRRIAVSSSCAPRQLG